MTVNHVRLGQAQQVNGAGNIVRRQAWAGWSALGILSQQLIAIREMRQRIGIHDAGIDDIDPDTLRTKFLCQGAGQCLERRF